MKTDTCTLQMKIISITNIKIYNGNGIYRIYTIQIEIIEYKLKIME